MCFKGFGENYQGNAIFATLAGWVKVRAEAAPAIKMSIIFIDIFIFCVFKIST